MRSTVASRRRVSFAARHEPASLHRGRSWRCRREGTACSRQGHCVRSGVVTGQRGAHQLTSRPAKTGRAHRKLRQDLGCQKNRSAQTSGSNLKRKSKRDAHPKARNFSTSADASWGRACDQLGGPRGRRRSRSARGGWTAELALLAQASRTGDVDVDGEPSSRVSSIDVGGMTATVAIEALISR